MLINESNEIQYTLHRQLLLLAQLSDVFYAQNLPPKFQGVSKIAIK